MHRAEFDMVDDEPEPGVVEETLIDFEEDPVSVRDLDEEEEMGSGIYSDDPDRRIQNAELDNVLDEFVDVVNGRDLDGLAELLAPDVEVDFLGETSREGAVSAFNDLILRNPTLVMTRGDLQEDPIVALWAYDRDADDFDPFGFMTLELSDSDEGLVRRIDYVEDPGDPDELVLETPDRSELPEWWDWSELDED